MPQSDHTQQENESRHYQQNNQPQKQRSGKPGFFARVARRVTSVFAKFASLFKGSRGSKAPPPCSCRKTI